MDVFRETPQSCLYRTSKKQFGHIRYRTSFIVVVVVVVVVVAVAVAVAVVVVVVVVVVGSSLYL